MLLLEELGVSGVYQAEVTELPLKVRGPPQKSEELTPKSAVVFQPSLQQLCLLRVPERTAKAGAGCWAGQWPQDCARAFRSWPRCQPLYRDPSSVSEVTPAPEGVAVMPRWQQAITHTSPPANSHRRRHPQASPDRDRTGEGWASSA